MEQWVAQEYQGKEFQKGTAVILTQKGERVRSKSEKILADYFYQHNIPYKYEKPLYSERIWNDSSGFYVSLQKNQKRNILGT